MLRLLDKILPETRQRFTNRLGVTQVFGYNDLADWIGTYCEPKCTKAINDNDLKNICDKCLKHVDIRKPYNNSCNQESILDDHFISVHTNCVKSVLGFKG